MMTKKYISLYNIKNMKNIFFVLSTFIFIQCTNPLEKEDTVNSFIMETTVKQTVDSLVSKYGEEFRERVSRGVNQAAFYWNSSDGSEQDFMKYCTDNFIADDDSLFKYFNRISENLETIFGYSTRITTLLQIPVQLDIGEVLPVDEVFAAYMPLNHLRDDFYNNKLAFFIILNFPKYSLEEKTTLGPTWSSQEWAYARLGDLFDSRVPASVSQTVTDALTKSDIYISSYNIFAGNLVDSSKRRLFPVDTKLLSHWNLRDEIKADYGRENEVELQSIIYEVMKRIITQDIPAAVINSQDYFWDPFENIIYEKKESVQYNELIPAFSGPGEIITDITPETDVRYAHMLENFHAQQNMDEYFQGMDTYLKRNFESVMEIPIEDVKSLFHEYLTAPELSEVAVLVRERLGRDLEPWDIWYDGFKSRSTIPAETLEQATAKKYPDREALQADLPRMLENLGFGPAKAEYIASKIQVDAARGSGHALGAEMKSEKSYLRTRILPGGMDYKGYNIAVHEFGHNVEQTISLHYVDHYLLKGVPNTAFTEALAFMFQERDLELLGFSNQDKQADKMYIMDSFWSLAEIMAVSLVDIRTWEWLYENPSATATELRDAVVSIAKDVWNEYFAGLYGKMDEPVLAIYSHMISYPLYLPNYAYGSIIAFQLEEYLKGRDFATEVERIFSLGRLTPRQWMQDATGETISVEPILRAVRGSL